MPNIKLPDGNVKHFEHPITIHDVAQSISPSLAKAALAGRVNGQLVDTSYTLSHDCELVIITEKQEKDSLEVIRHSTAHLLAQAVKSLFPNAQVTIGPVIEDGFYYDFAFGRPFTPEDLERIEEKCRNWRRLISQLRVESCLAMKPLSIFAVWERSTKLKLLLIFLLAK